MDTRAALLLRLQRSDEGLSIVAISDYTVNLAAYRAYPLTKALGRSKGMITAAFVSPVIAAVWLAPRRLRNRLH